MDRQGVVDALQRKWHAEVVERVAPTLIGHGVFQTFDDVQTFVARVDEGARFDSLAGSLLSGPDGTRVRRPPQRRVKTVDLIHEVAPLGDRA
jgi:hypothetical protein